MSARPRHAMGLAVAIAGATGIGIACGPGFLDGISGGAVADSGVPDSARESGPTCDSRLAPEAPPGSDDSTKDTPIPTLAFEQMRFDTFGAGDAGGPIPKGLDLDQKCTCPETDSCVRPTDAGRNGCDGPRGEDNALALLFNGLNAGLEVFPHTFATDRIREGFFTVLVDVMGWNGEKDDPRVVVTLRTSQFLEGKKGSKADGGIPRFDGTDVWTVDPSTIGGGDDALGSDCRDPKLAFRCVARVRDDAAYVRDGVLVAHLRRDNVQDGPVPVLVRSSLGQLDLEIFGLTLTGRLSGSPGSYRLEGEMAGRVSATTALTTFANLQDYTKADEPPICQNEPLLQIARSQVCAARDLAPLGKDRTGAACDHISLALSFLATPATAGTVFRKDPVGLPCGDTTYRCD